MSRIRSIKPEFPQSETIGKLSRDARLLFIQLWTFVDDAGRARGASRVLASLLYPYDDDARELIDGWLDELVNAGCLVIYRVEDSTYIQITNWLKHQKIDKPSPSRIPPFTEGSGIPREPSRGVAREHRALALDMDQEGIGSGEERRGPGEETKASAPAQHECRADARPSGDLLNIKELRRRGTRLAEDWRPSPEDERYALEHGVDPALAAEEFRNYWLARADRDATKLDWSRTFQNRILELRDRRKFALAVAAARPESHLVGGL